MKPTRQHIADKALVLFNERGFVNVRLQHIADAAFVSIGHLAYHFKNKDALLEYLFEAICQEKEQMLNAYKMLPLFEDTGRMLESMYRHQQRYRFFYTDTLEINRACPALAEKRHRHIQWQRLQLSLMIQFNISRGAMQLRHGTPDLVARLLQRFIDNWLHGVQAGDETANGLPFFMEDAWHFLSAYFTSMGFNEYRQYLNGGNTALQF